MKKLFSLTLKILAIFFGVILITFCILSIIATNTTMINHRGYSHTAPENTLSAYELSAKKGYKYVECDVDFTSDGVPVLLHDSTIDRTAGVNTNVNIREITYEQALNYDFGYKDKFGDIYKNEKIPTFYEFITLCENKNLCPYVEIKNQGGKYAYTDEQIKLLVDVVNSSSLTDVTWISFDYNVLLKIKNLDNTARLGYLKNKITDEAISQALELKTGKNKIFINANFGYLTPKKIRKVKKAKLGLEVWTVNIRAVAVILSPFVDGITTDKIIYN